MGPYCFAKSHVRRDKVVNFHSACSKILPPKSYFLEQCYHIQFTGIFHRGFCFTLDCSFEQCLIYLSFSKVVFHVGQGKVKDGAPSMPALLDYAVIAPLLGIPERTLSISHKFSKSPS